MGNGVEGVVPHLDSKANSNAIVIDRIMSFRTLFVVNCGNISLYTLNKLKSRVDKLLALLSVISSLNYQILVSATR